MTPRDLTEDDVLGISGARGEPDWLRDRRLEAFKAFCDLDWPTNRTEEWRYTDPRRLTLDRAVVTEPGEIRRLDAGITVAAGHLDGSLRIVDGAVVEANVCTEAAEQGVVVTDLATAAREHPDIVRAHLGAAVGAGEKFDALNLAGFTTGAFIHVPDDVELTSPIAVTVQVTRAGAFLPRILVVAEAHAKAVVYVDHAGDAGSAASAGRAGSTVVEAIEAIVGAGARLDVVTAQDWGADVDHVASHRGLLYADGTYRHLEITLGGRTVYIRPDVKLDHPGSNALLLGVYFSSEDQRFEHRSLIQHNASQTSSELVYKGALQGTSRATFFGNIRIEPHARGTASDQTNRNLILTEGAKADSIPFLEIENSDVVRCGHHSSIGQIDEAQLFYLESRGIPREEAAKLLVYGFFGEVTDRIDLPGITETVLAEIEQEIRSGPTALMDPRRR
jgi:Fe-S cluster assembly protein SufD